MDHDDKGKSMNFFIAKAIIFCPNQLTVISIQDILKAEAICKGNGKGGREKSICWQELKIRPQRNILKDSLILKD